MRDSIHDQSSVRRCRCQDSLAAFGAGPRPRPNIVLVLTDDLDYNLIRDNLGRSIDGTVFMPRLIAWRIRVSLLPMPLSRFPSAALRAPRSLRGQYPHNTGVLGNVPPLGGFQTFYRLGRESSTIATWLKGAGYKTALIGKYLNKYPASAGPLYVPPGWDEWRVKTRSRSRDATTPILIIFVSKTASVVHYPQRQPIT